MQCNRCYTLLQAKLHSKITINYKKKTQIIFPQHQTKALNLHITLYNTNYPLRILSNRSTLFRALSSWWSTLFLDFSWQSTLLRDLSIWSKDTFNFSSLSALMNWFFSFSGLSVLFFGLSLRSVLFLETS